MTDVLVVGAGVAGCHAARELSADHDVRVLEADEVAGGATGLSAGVVAPTLFYGDEPTIAQHANEFFRSFDGTEGFAFTERNRLDFVPAADEAAQRATAERLADRGFPVTYRSASAVEDAYPGIHVDDYAGAVEYRDAGWVDPHRYASALAAAARTRGATVETDVTVDALAVADGRVVGVETDAGRYDADAVVLAAGWRTQQLLPDGVDLPVRPYRTQVVVLEPESPLADDFPIGRVGDEHLYFRPEHNGDLLVGGAHSLVDRPADQSPSADESFKLDVAAFVPELLDGFAHAGFVNGWAGVDTATPDTRPVVDDVGPEGLVVATGFNGLGVMASPVVGPTVRERVTGEAAPFDTAAFALDRFDSTSSDFAYVSTSEI